MEDFKSIFFDLFLLLLFVLLNALFVAAEFALVKVRKTQLLPEEISKNGKAKLALRLITNLDQSLAATQFGITISSLGLGWIGEPVTARILEPLFQWLSIDNPKTIHTISLSVGFVLITFLHIIIGELAPKSLAIRHPKQTTLFIAWPLNIFYLIFKLPIIVLNTAANKILKIVGIEPVSEFERSHSEEEIRMLISEGTKSGEIDETEQAIIQKVFGFNDKTAEDVMIPRNKMFSIDIEDNRNKIIEKMIDEGYSRVPVYKDTIDNIIGIIYSKDIISAAEHKEVIVLQDIIRPVHFIPETKHIGEILKDFQKNNIHLGIVVNEHGGVEGLITLEDIIEEIFGEIEDEYDTETDGKNIKADRKGIYLLNPNITIEEFNKLLNADIPVDPDEYQTLSGFLQKVTGHVPDIYERIDYKGLVMTIMQKSGIKLLQVKVQKLKNY
ncbi:MAG TPA: hemolysin family protein [Ignavibacteria bacterium]|nr:hemolysin family protein [Ignavibacteria bacterium]HMR39196.1 hemolysin family protein [Ignavibacteria bacterium]